MRPVLYARNPDVVLREEDEDGALLFNPDSGEVRVLNVSGLFLWKNCIGCSLDELLSRLDGAFEGVPAESARRDVEHFLSSLLSGGFLGELGPRSK